MGTISHTISCPPPIGRIDQTQQSTTLAPGASATLTVIFGTCGIFHFFLFVLFVYLFFTNLFFFSLFKLIFYLF